jgi:hypothetical protein
MKSKKKVPKSKPKPKSKAKTPKKAKPKSKKKPAKRADLVSTLILPAAGKDGQVLWLDQNGAMEWRDPPVSIDLSSKTEVADELKRPYEVPFDENEVLLKDELVEQTREEMTKSSFSSRAWNFLAKLFWR